MTINELRGGLPSPQCLPVQVFPYDHLIGELGKRSCELDVALSCYEDESNSIMNMSSVVDKRPWIEYMSSIKKKRIKSKRRFAQLKPDDFWAKDCSLCSQNSFSAKNIPIKKLARNPLLDMGLLGPLYFDNFSLPI